MKTLKILIAAVVLGVAAGCASIDPALVGAAIGGAAGAKVGGTGGAALGAVAGAAVGANMRQSAGATVQPQPAAITTTVTRTEIKKCTPSGRCRVEVWENGRRIQ